MAIHILYGPGGAGKSYYQMRLIYDELAYGERNVVTNLTIDLGKLQEYLEKHNPALKIDVCKRVRILTDVETLEFWKYRGVAPLVLADLWEGLPLVDQSYDLESAGNADVGARGVLYVIDEAGAAGFSATGWSAKENNTVRGVACSWYLDQQRKFSDNVYASTNGRRPSGIAKPFRDKAHYFIKLKNGYLASYGIFKGRGRFTASHYTHEPDSSSEPMREEHWSLDASGLAGCYRTQDGVGVRGNRADVGARAKGIPVVFAPVMFIALAVVVAVLIPLWLAKGAAKVAKSKAAEYRGVVGVDEKKSPSGAKPDTAVGNPPAAPVKSSEPPAVNNNAPALEPVRVSGVVQTASGAQVELTDGRVLQSGVDWMRIERTFVESPKGTRYYFKRPVSRPPEHTRPPKTEEPAKTAELAPERQKAWSEGRGEQPDGWTVNPAMNVMGSGHQMAGQMAGNAPQRPPVSKISRQ